MYLFIYLLTLFFRVVTDIDSVVVTVIDGSTEACQACNGGSATLYRLVTDVDGNISGS